MHFNIKSRKTKKVSRLNLNIFVKLKERMNARMITLQDVIQNKEVEALINGAQKQLDGLRLY